MAIGEGCAWKALPNFFSELRSASSAARRAVISRTDAYGRDGELHRELAAIAPQRGQLDPLVQDWALAGGEEASQAGRMGLAMRLRHDDVGQELPQDLPFSPSEHGLGLLVPRRDSTDVIHRDVGVERRVEDRREPSLRGAQGLLGSSTVDCRFDLCRYELEHLFVMLLVANSGGVGLHGKHADGSVSLLEGHAQPVD